MGGAGALSAGQIVEIVSSSRHFVVQGGLRAPCCLRNPDPRIFAPVIVRPMNPGGRVFRALPSVCPLLLLALVVGGSAPAQALQQDTRAYQSLVGSWDGVLEYLDYGDDRTLVQLPTHLVAKPIGNDAGLLFAFSYQEPDGRVVTSTGGSFRHPTGSTSGRSGKSRRRCTMARPEISASCSVGRVRTTISRRRFGAWS